MTGKTQDRTFGEGNQRAWEVTFSDMLMLLLTFFIFIISISSFKALKYKQFWDETAVTKTKEKRAATTSFKFELIHGLKTPSFSAETELLLSDIEGVFTTHDAEGLDVNYSENKISLMVSEQLGFAEAQYQLSDRMKTLLMKLKDPINRSKFDISVEGHTDSSAAEGATGAAGDTDNTELSLRRALAVARFLINGGTDRKKILVAGYGPHRPIAKNDTPEGRSRNRRVEIHILIRSD